MDQSKLETDIDLVPHPRFGTGPIPSGLNVSRETVAGASWKYRSGAFFEESAIEADISRQNVADYHQPYYVDVLKQCLKCHRHFLFFALEQQFWFEVLQFNLDADCRECPECRRPGEKARRLWKHYSANVNRTDLDDRELATLIEDALRLFTVGLLKADRIRRFKNLAKRRLPEAPVTQRLLTQLAALDGEAPPTEEPTAETRS